MQPEKKTKLFYHYCVNNYKKRTKKALVKSQHCHITDRSREQSRILKLPESEEAKVVETGAREEEKE